MEVLNASSFAVDATKKWMEEIAIDTNDSAFSPLIGGLNPAASPTGLGTFRLPSDFKEEASDEEVLLAAVDASASAVNSAIDVLNNLSARAEYQAPHVSAGIVECIVLVMRSNDLDAEVQAAGCGALCRLGENCDTRFIIERSIMDDVEQYKEGVMHAIIEALENHAINARVVSQAIKAIEVLIRTPAQRTALDKAGLERGITAVRRATGCADAEVQQLASSILSQLGCGQDEPQQDSVDTTKLVFGNESLNFLSEVPPYTSTPFTFDAEPLWTPWAIESTSASSSGTVTATTAGATGSCCSDLDESTTADCLPSEATLVGVGLTSAPSSPAGPTPVAATAVTSPAVPPRSNKSKKKKRKRDPNTPRGPRSAYVFFSQMTCEDIRKEHPDATPAELSKMMGHKWGLIADEDRKVYNELAEKDKERHNKEMEEFRYKRLCAFA